MKKYSKRIKELRSKLVKDSYSFEESIKAYETAKSINPYFSLNYLELAKAYKKNDNIEKAKFNLKKIATIPNYNEDDKRIKNEALVLLKKWN